MGEVVHGDYRKWVNPETLHSVTNYECYKGLYSSLLEGNYFEIAYALNRQFGNEGIYRDMHLYNFVDNHDVDRVASKLGNSSLLYPLYLLLFTMPGLPSIYYGSEWGLQGEKGQWSDATLRPTLAINQIVQEPPEQDLVKVIAKLAGLRKKFKALRTGSYQPLKVDHRQMAFVREEQEECLLVLLNSASEGIEIEVETPWGERSGIDLLDPEFHTRVDGGKMMASIPPQWGRILKLE